MLGSLAAPAYAVLASICFAASQVTMRRGLVHTTIFAGVLISMSSALLATGVFVVVNPPAVLRSKGILLFAVAGLAAPGVSRWASATGIHALGPSVAVPITQGARPLLAVAGAVVLLGETFTLLQVVGLAGILAGGWELSRGRAEARAATTTARGVRKKRVLRRGAMFPLIAAAAYAMSDLVLKEALFHVDSPPFGAFVAMATASVIWVAVASLVPPIRNEIRVGQDFGWLVLSGGLTGIALVNLNAALDAGNVSVVSPITASQPLFVFVFSRLMLRDLEKLHPSVVVAGVAVVTGTVIVSL